MNTPSKTQAKEMMKEGKPWVRRFGRFGCMSKGIVYGVIGVLGALAAVGPGGETTGTAGALQSISEKPFGEAALWIIGIGLIGSILWDFIKVFKDPDNEGNNAKGIIKRIGFFISAIIYANLAFGAIKLASHTGNAGGDDSEKIISGKLMEQPFGVWLIGLLGAIIIGYGLYELYIGAKEKFMVKFNTSDMNSKELKVTRISGKIGLMAHGMVISMVGFFFIQTAYRHNPEESEGFGGVLSELASQPYGQFFLGIAAVGFVFFGIYQFILGRYQSMNFGHHGK